MSGVLKARTAVGPDVWTPVNGGQINLPSATKSGVAAGVDAGGPTVGTTPLVVKTTTIPVFGVPGTLHVWLPIRMSKTVATDRFTILLQLDGVSIGGVAGDSTTVGATVEQFYVSGAVDITGTATRTLTVVVTRFAGTGTASMVVDTVNFVLHWAFVPTGTGSSVDYGTLDTRYVNADGDTMPGILQAAAPVTPIQLRGTTGAWSIIEFYDGTTRCGYVGKDTTENIQLVAESGKALYLTGTVRLPSAQGTDVRSATRKDYVDGLVAPVRYRMTRAAANVATGDQVQGGTGSFLENSGGWSGSGTAVTPLIVPAIGSYAITLYYAGTNFTTSTSAAIVELNPGGTHMIPILAGTTVKVGGTITKYLGAGVEIVFKIRNMNGATANVTMEAEVVRVSA